MYGFVRNVVVSSSRKSPIRVQYSCNENGCIKSVKTRKDIERAVNNHLVRFPEVKGLWYPLLIKDSIK